MGNVTRLWYSLVGLSGITSPNGLHKNQIDYIITPKRWSCSIQFTKTLNGADCGLDHELLVAGVKIKLKKIRKGTLPQRYDQFIADVKNLMRNIDVGTSQREELWQSIKRAVREAAKKISKTKANKGGLCGCRRLQYRLRQIGVNLKHRVAIKMLSID